MLTEYNSKMNEFNFIWKIENFNFLPPQRGKALISPSFNVNLLGKTCLELYPKGDILDPGGESIIVCLHNCIKLPHTSVSCDLKLEQGWGTIVEFKSEKIHDGTKWRFKKDQIKLNPRFVGSSLLTVNDEFTRSTLLVTCKFVQNPDMSKSPKNVSKQDSKDMLLLSKDMENLYVEQQFCDITLCTENHKFPTHKAVLYSRLPKLLGDIEPGDDCKEKQISDIEPEVLRCLLNYAYSGKISAVGSCIPGGLYPAAHSLELDDLKLKMNTYPNEVTARTCIKVDHNLFVWPIADVQALRLNEKRYSPAFTGGSIKNSELKLVCYLAKNAEGRESIEICIHRVFPDKNNPIFVRCKITIDDDNLLSRCAEHVFVADQEWHFPTFIFTERKDDKLIVATSFYNKCSADLKTILKCEFSISGCETSEIEETKCAAVGYEQFSNCGEDVRNLCSDLGQLYNIFLPKVSDVTLLIGDVRFPAHKAVLAARSPVFSRMFDSDMLEKKSGIVKITDCDIAVLNMMLKYIYSAKVDVLTYDCAIKLYSAADKYEITSLKDRCAAFLKKLLNADNVCEVLLLADMHADAELKGFAKEFIDAHAHVILESGEWKNLIETRVDLASEILHSLVTVVLNHKKVCGLC